MKMTSYYGCYCLESHRDEIYWEKCDSYVCLFLDMHGCLHHMGVDFLTCMDVIFLKYGKMIDYR